MSMSFCVPKGPLFLGGFGALSEWNRGGHVLPEERKNGGNLTGSDPSPRLPNEPADDRPRGRFCGGKRGRFSEVRRWGGNPVEACHGVGELLIRGGWKPVLQSGIYSAIHREFMAEPTGRNGIGSGGLEDRKKPRIFGAVVGFGPAPLIWRTVGNLHLLIVVHQSVTSALCVVVYKDFCKSGLRAR